MRKKIVTAVVLVLAIAFAVPAFAANPFMDVPANHWAYDAVAQLAARGVVSGYPDGAYKGTQPTTRYEMASVVARALAKVDKEKASKQDLQMLKKLVMEFKDELDALGVKVDKIDKRVAVLEDCVGGWKLTGNMVFDANWGSNVNTYTSVGQRNEFEFTTGHINLMKKIDDKNFVFTRFAMDRDRNTFGNRDNNIGIDRMYWQGQISPIFKATVGRFEIDWEADAGLRSPHENDSWFNSAVMDGFKVDAQFTPKFDATAVIARNITSAHYPAAINDGNGDDIGCYGLRLNAHFTENFWGGLTGTLVKNDNNLLGVPEFNTFGAYLGYNTYDNKVGLRGMYYGQDIDDAAPAFDSPKAWKAALVLDQKLLKFTGLWAEYGQMDAGFIGAQANAYNFMDGYRSGIVPFNSAAAYSMMPADANFLLLHADQKWNDKWSSFLRYAQADYDVLNADTVKNYSVGIKYQYTPAVAFQLAYDDVNYGNLAPIFGLLNDDHDHIVRFRTTVNF